MKYDLLVNKENPLPNDYVPEGLVEYPEYNGPKIDPTHKTLVEKETLEAFWELQAAAKADGYHIIIDSAYRSYDYQVKVLNHWLEKEGEKAYTFVAMPGTSEHQTGLAFDIALYRNGEYTDCFKDTDSEIIWAQENAYKFGFILRYPKGKEDITGFNYESWHFRFVGKDVSEYMHNNNILTLEEYHLALKQGR